MNAASLSVGPSLSLTLAPARTALLARVLFMMLVAAYVGVFAWTYLRYTAETYYYLGLGLDPDQFAVSVGWALALSLIPAAWFPLGTPRPSRIFLLVQFFVIYVPSLFLTFHSTLPVLDVEQRFGLCLAMFAAMLILIWSQRAWPLLKLPAVRLPAWVFWTIVYGGAAGCLLLLAALFRDSIQLVSLPDIYLVRDRATDVLDASGNAFAAYAFFWLNNVFLPLIFAHGIMRRRTLQLLAVVGAYLFLFAIWGSKASLLAPGILLLVSIFLARKPDRMNTMFALGLMGLLLVPVLLPFDAGLGSLAKLWWVSIFHMRTIAVPALLESQYLGFFADHPLTLGSHLTGISAIVPYQYDYDIPRTVGYYFYGDLMTANANFWAQDGIAGFGLFGLVAMSVVAAGVFWVLDSVAYKLPPRLVLPALACALLAFANTSLFTTMVTGGLGLLLLAFWCFPHGDHG